ncbi:LacI family DNA-binding transcriptional regulator [Streptomyces poonensis]|nr:LacI family DNA-binding transcriptional regulator [Streptomyces poonensis]
MVSITDVARHAGVAPSTVSYALSGKRPISEETRRRVRAAVRELGYRPHTGAGAWTGRGAKVLALVAPLRAGDARAQTVMAYALSVVAAARGHDHDVLLIMREESEDGLRRVADGAPADALIVLGAPRNARPPLLRSLGRPSVLIGSPADPTGLTCVDLDSGAAGELCVEHLAELGHRTVALVGAPPVSLGGTVHAQRVLRGFAAAAGRLGLSSSVHPCPASPAAARAVAEGLLRERPAPTGVVVHDEGVVRLLIDAFETLGQRIPDDLSVAAVRPAGLLTDARLPLSVTSAEVPAAQLGAAAVDLLIRKLNGTHVPETALLPPRLTHRASTSDRPRS